VEAVDGYKRTALALQGLSRQEQEWFLVQLDDADRERVARLLHGMGDSGTAGNAGTQERHAAAAIGAASDETLASVLHTQPDWVVALLLMEVRQSSAVRRYVAQLDADRKQRIQELTGEMHKVKPNVRAAVAGSIASSMPERPADFETALTRAANG
jgi:hypothetical protein